jgi:transcription antitermination factor NusG
VSSGLYERPVSQDWNATFGVEPEWYAVHTRSQHEKSVVSYLQGGGITTFLPLVTEVHRWSDRRKLVELPLFSCYVFVRISLVPELWHKVMKTSGVLGFVGAGREGIPIPEGQIESIRKLVGSSTPYTVCPFLKVGQRVRIRGGALDSIEGILIARNGDRKLVVSVEPIQRSLAIRIDDYNVEPV